MCGRIVVQREWNSGVAIIIMDIILIIVIIIIKMAPTEHLLGPGSILGMCRLSSFQSIEAGIISLDVEMGTQGPRASDQAV